MKILITGGTGFIGTATVQKLAPGHELTILTRNPETAKARLGLEHEYLRSLATLTHLDDFDAVINLAGEPIAEGRWTKAKKRAICDSRWHITEQLARLAGQGKSPPDVWINASAIGIYGDRGETRVDESTPVNPMGFPEQVCEKWEALAHRVEALGTRLCILRIGLVMHPSGGALKKMLPAFRFGLGGPMGHGMQQMAWIHRDDLVNQIVFLLEQPECRGVFNGTAPNPVSNEEFSKTLGKVLGRPAVLRAPAAALKLALGEMSELLLTGQAVLPNAALKAGFEFQYPELEAAFDNLLKRS